MNQDIVTGKWQDIKGEIRSRWAKLTDDDLEKAKGNFESIAGLIQQRYGDAKESATKKLNEIVDRFGQQASDAKKAVADKTEDMKQSLRDDSDKGSQH